MNHLKRLNHQVFMYLFMVVLLSNLILAMGWYVATERFHFSLSTILIGGSFTVLLLVGGLAWLATSALMQPVRMLWQAILHVSPEPSTAPAPKLDQIHLGRELVTSLVMQVYQLASNNGVELKATAASSNASNEIMNSLPLPLITMNKEQSVLFVNDAARKYLGQTAAEVVGKNVYDILDLSFSSEDTYDTWLATARASSATASHSWEHVRLKAKESDEVQRFDMAAYYSKDHPSGVESAIALFDHGVSYSQSEQAIDFVALAVHELRNPLTLLRGYIDVFEDELDGKLDKEMAGFMKKMQVAAQQMASFINNILNVARVEEGQLVLELHEQTWGELVASVIKDYEVQASIHGMTLEFSAPAELPTVGADRISIYEVLSNLLENAIKYSGAGPKKIVVRTALRKDGMIETTVQDNGVGIAETSLGHLFEKFYRSHHTRQQVSGTGLGLYLCKAIVEAHGGQIWVESKEGQGATFGFTLQPYVMIAHKLKTSSAAEGDSNGIVRVAHGWIKNHSLYRK